LLRFHHTVYYCTTHVWFTFPRFTFRFTVARLHRTRGLRCWLLPRVWFTFTLRLRGWLLRFVTTHTVYIYHLPHHVVTHALHRTLPHGLPHHTLLPLHPAGSPLPAPLIHLYRFTCGSAGLVALHTWLHTHTTRVLLRGCTRTRSLPHVWLRAARTVTAVGLRIWLVTTDTPRSGYTRLIFCTVTFTRSLHTHVRWIFGYRSVWLRGCGLPRLRVRSVWPHTRTFAVRYYHTRVYTFPVCGYGLPVTRLYYPVVHTFGYGFRLVMPFPVYTPATHVCSLVTVGWLVYTRTVPFGWFTVALHRTFPHYTFTQFILHVLVILRLPGLPHVTVLRFWFTRLLRCYTPHTVVTGWFTLVATVAVAVTRGCITFTHTTGLLHTRTFYRVCRTVGCLPRSFWFTVHTGCGCTRTPTHRGLRYLHTHGCVLRLRFYVTHMVTFTRFTHALRYAFTHAHGLRLFTHCGWIRSCGYVTVTAFTHCVHTHRARYGLFYRFTFDLPRSCVAVTGYRLRSRGLPPRFTLRAFCVYGYVTVTGYGCYILHTLRLRFGYLVWFLPPVTCGLRFPVTARFLPHVRSCRGWILYTFTLRLHVVTPQFYRARLRVVTVYYAGYGYRLRLHVGFYGYGLVLAVYARTDLRLPRFYYGCTVALPLRLHTVVARTLRLDLPRLRTHARYVLVTCRSILHTHTHVWLLVHAVAFALVPRLRSDFTQFTWILRIRFTPRFTARAVTLITHTYTLRFVHGLVHCYVARCSYTPPHLPVDFTRTVTGSLLFSHVLYTLHHTVTHGCLRTFPRFTVTHVAFYGLFTPYTHVVVYTVTLFTAHLRLRYTGYVPFYHTHRFTLGLRLRLVALRSFTRCHTPRYVTFTRLRSPVVTFRLDTLFTLRSHARYVAGLRLPHTRSAVAVYVGLHTAHAVLTHTGCGWFTHVTRFTGLRSARFYYVYTLLVRVHTFTLPRVRYAFYGWLLTFTGCSYVYARTFYTRYRLRLVTLLVAVAHTLHTPRSHTFTPYRTRLRVPHVTRCGWLVCVCVAVHGCTTLHRFCCGLVALPALVTLHTYVWLLPFYTLRYVGLPHTAVVLRYAVYTTAGCCYPLPVAHLDYRSVPRYTRYLRLRFADYTRLLPHAGLRDTTAHALRTLVHTATRLYVYVLPAVLTRVTTPLPVYAHTVAFYPIHGFACRATRLRIAHVLAVYHYRTGFCYAHWLVYAVLVPVGCRGSAFVQFPRTHALRSGCSYYCAVCCRLPVLHHTVYWLRVTFYCRSVYTHCPHGLQFGYCGSGWIHYRLLPRSDFTTFYHTLRWLHTHTGYAVAHTVTFIHTPTRYVPRIRYTHRCAVTLFAVTLGLRVYTPPPYHTVCACTTWFTAVLRYVLLPVGCTYTPHTRFTPTFGLPVGSTVYVATHVTVDTLLPLRGYTRSRTFTARLRFAHVTFYAPRRLHVTVYRFTFTFVGYTPLPAGYVWFHGLPFVWFTTHVWLFTFTVTFTVTHVLVTFTLFSHAVTHGWFVTLHTHVVQLPYRLHVVHCGCVGLHLPHAFTPHVYAFYVHTRSQFTRLVAHTRLRFTLPAVARLFTHLLLHHVYRTTRGWLHWFTGCWCRVLPVTHLYRYTPAGWLRLHIHVCGYRFTFTHCRLVTPFTLPFYHYYRYTARFPFGLVTRSLHVTVTHVYTRSVHGLHFYILRDFTHLHFTHTFTVYGCCYVCDLPAVIDSV